MADRELKRGSYRSTNAVLLDDPGWQKLPERARHLFLTAKHSRLTNMAGIFVCDAGGFYTLAAQTGMSMKVLRVAFDSLCDTHWIVYQEPIVWIRNQLRFDPHINLNNKKQAEGVQNVLKGLPNLEIIAKFCDHYDLTIPTGMGIDSLSSGYRSSDPDSDSESDTEPDTESERILSGKPDRVDVIPYQIIIEHLNQVTGKNYQHKSGVTRQLIRGRWGEGFREADFFHVHFVKAEKWLGSDMEKYLRPVTLYNISKFEGYLNERRGLIPMTDKARNNIAVGIQWLQSKGFSFDSEGTPRILSDAEQAGKGILPATGSGHD